MGVEKNIKIVMANDTKNIINIEDFAKLEIKIGKVISAEKVPEADKLLKLVVDFGGKENEPSEQRQIMSGIAEYFPEPSVLVGQEMPFVTNLEPRKLRGYDSEGMILAITSGEKVVLLHPETEVPAGSIVK